MIARKAIALLLAIGFPLLASATTAIPAQAQAEVEFLLGFVRDSDCMFYRNGTWSDAHAAEAHLREKYDFLAAADRILTTTDFIEKVATKSSLSGEDYQVRCKAQTAVASGPWLIEALVRHRTQNEKPAQRDNPGRPAVVPARAADLP